MTQTVFDGKLFFNVLKEHLAPFPESQISKRIKTKIVEFVSQERQDIEIYDFMLEIYNEPETEISSFVKQVCNVGQFYKRPET